MSDIKSKILERVSLLEANLNEIETKLTEILVSEITPIGKEIKKLLQDRAYLEAILIKGKKKASIIAEENLKNIREKVGLI